MNNPLQMIAQMMRGGGSPQQLLGQLARQNPQMAQAMQLLEGKSQQQQMTILRNMASERGVDLDAMAQQIARQLGLPMR